MPKPRHKKKFFGGKQRRINTPGKIKLFIFFSFSFIIVSIGYTFSQVDEKILPTVMAIAEKTAKNSINAAIDNSLHGILSEENIKSSDFYNKASDINGQVNSFTVNTVEVNKVCSKLAIDISNEVGNLDNEKVEVPLGAVFNLGVFSNMGPNWPITISPLGTSEVNYFTEFRSVGINQINFQLWLNVETSVRIVNPLQSHDYTVIRKIPLVDTIFSGEVPETYLNNFPVGENLKKN